MAHRTSSESIDLTDFALDDEPISQAATLYPVTAPSVSARTRKEVNKNRALLAAEFCICTLPEVSTKRTYRVHCGIINKVFGRTNTKLGRQFRTVLSVTDDYIVSTPDIDGQSKQYAHKESALVRLLDYYGHDGKAVIASLKKALPQSRKEALHIAHREELVTGKFAYVSKDGRDYHPIQNLKRSQRDNFLKDYGFIFDYDMSAACQTLVYQAARRYNMQLTAEYEKKSRAVPKSKWLELDAIVDYIENKSAIRQQICKQFNVTASQAKELMNAITFGAATWSNSATMGNVVHTILDCKNIRKFHDFTKKYRQQLGTAFRAVRSDKKLFMFTGVTKLPRITAKVKSSTYFSLEDTIRKVVQMYCDLHSIKVFTIHDGFMTDVPIKMESLTAFIQKKLGFDDTLSIDQVNVNDNPSIYGLIAAIGSVSFASSTFSSSATATATGKEKEVKLRYEVSPPNTLLFTRVESRQSRTERHAAQNFTPQPIPPPE